MSMPDKLTPEQQLIKVVIDTCLEEGIITIAGIIDAFPPSVIMEGLRERPDRRADLLKACTGYDRRNTAMKKSPEETAAEIVGAIDAGDTNPEQIWGALGSEDFVRYQPKGDVWAFAFVSDWPDMDSKENRAAMVALVNAVQSLQLLGYPEMVRAIGYEEYGEHRFSAGLHKKFFRSWGEMQGGESPFTASASQPSYFEHLWRCFPPEEPSWPLSVLRRVLRVVAYRNHWEVPPDAVLVPPGTPPLPDSKDEPDTAALVPDGDAPKPAEIATGQDEVLLELDADVPSGVHPGAAVPPAPPLPPPPGGGLLGDLPGGLFAGAFPGPPEEGHADAAGFAAAAAREGSATSHLPHEAPAAGAFHSGTPGVALGSRKSSPPPPPPPRHKK